MWVFPVERQGLLLYLNKRTWPGPRMWRDWHRDDSVTETNDWFILKHSLSSNVYINVWDVPPKVVKLKNSSWILIFDFHNHIIFLTIFLNLNLEFTYTIIYLWPYFSNFSLRLLFQLTCDLFLCSVVIMKEKVFYHNIRHTYTCLSKPRLRTSNNGEQWSSMFCICAIGDIVIYNNKWTL